MKKIISNNKKLFLGLIIGIMFSGITAYAAYSYLATDITYAPSNTEWNVNNVSGALDYLYTEENKEIWERLDLSTTSSAYVGDRVIDRTASLNLEKGNYLVFGINNYVAPVSSGTSSSSDITQGSTISTSNGNCSLISGYVSYSVPSETYTTTYYMRTITISHIWKCELESDGIVTVSDTEVASDKLYLPGTLMARSIKLD